MNTRGTKSQWRIWPDNNSDSEVNVKAKRVVYLVTPSVRKGIEYCVSLGLDSNVMIWRKDSAEAKAYGWRKVVELKIESEFAMQELAKLGGT